jgi:hypothetical protein
VLDLAKESGALKLTPHGRNIRRRWMPIGWIVIWIPSRIAGLASIIEWIPRSNPHSPPGVDNRQDPSGLHC